MGIMIIFAQLLKMSADNSLIEKIANSAENKIDQEFSSYMHLSPHNQ